MPGNQVAGQGPLNLRTGQLRIVDVALDLQALVFDFAGAPTSLAGPFLTPHR
jgi:hypothetical protein